jgi:hypothetical protein
MTPLVGEGTVGQEAIEQMRKRGGTWAAYQNHAFDSADFGGLRFLQYGPDRTLAAPPPRYPDSPAGVGWRYLHVGYVDLASGKVVPNEPTTEEKDES